jgi:hypothetical protein
MLSFCRARRKSAATTQALPALQGHRGDAASLAQAHGLASLANISTARRTVSLPSISGGSIISPAATTSLPSQTANGVTESDGADRAVSEADQTAQKAQELADDKNTVEKELNRWVADPLWLKSQPLNLVRFWDVRFCFPQLIIQVTIYLAQESEMSYPLMFRVALDILPVQASAAPCERIFSSSKETCIVRRSLLSASLVEILQVLKQLYKEERLDFTSHWIAKEEDYSIEHATEAAIRELMSTGRTEELLDLLRSMDNRTVS